LTPVLSRRTARRRHLETFSEACQSSQLRSLSAVVPTIDRLSELFRVPDQTVEASRPPEFVPRASRLVRNSFMGNNDLCGSFTPFEAHGYPLLERLLRLQFPGVYESMGRVDELEYARYPDNGAVWKAVSYSVATAYTQFDLGRGTGDARWTPPVHQVLWLSPRGEQFLW
jgi:hypothetical protein